MSPRQPTEQRRLSRIRQPEQTDVRNELQFEQDPAFLAFLSRFGVTRRLVDGGGEVAIATLTS
jgi:hypothetical protein